MRFIAGLTDEMNGTSTGQSAHREVSKQRDSEANRALDVVSVLVV